MRDAIGNSDSLIIRMGSKKPKSREKLYDRCNNWIFLVTGGGGCLSASDEGGRELAQTGGIGAELRDKLLNGRLINTRPESFTALNRCKFQASDFAGDN